MTDHLALAIRRAIWARDAPRQDPAYIPPPQVPKPPAPPPPPPQPRPVLLKPWWPPQVVFLGMRNPIEIIQRAVATAYGMEVRALLSPRRSLKLVRPRHVAMYLSQELAQATLSQIGRRFNRDHTSVLHGIRKVEEICRTDLEFELELRKLMQEVRENLL